MVFPLPHQKVGHDNTVFPLPCQKVGHDSSLVSPVLQVACSASASGSQSPSQVGARVVHALGESTGNLQASGNRRQETPDTSSSSSEYLFKEPRQQDTEVTSVPRTREDKVTADLSTTWPTPQESSTCPRCSSLGLASQGSCICDDLILIGLLPPSKRRKL